MNDSSNTNELSWKNTNAASATAGGKKPYSQPQLIRHGDLRGITLSGSPGIGDSGVPASERN